MDRSILIGIVCFVAGMLFMYTFQNLVKIEISVKKKPTKRLNPKTLAVARMLDYLRKNKTLEIRLDKDVLESIRAIAHTKEWYKKIDAESLDSLYKIYLRWHSAVNPKGTQTAKLGHGENLAIADEPYIDDYEDEDEEEYHGEWLTMDENGQIEDYME